MNEKYNQNKLIEFLQILELNEVDYVIWKNLHKLDQSLNGFFNIDLYVPLSHRDKFIEVAKSKNCINTNHVVNNFPFISHYYLLGENNKVFHIHTYFKLITGESFLKEFDLPIEDLIFENRIKHDLLNIWIVNKKIYAYIFIIRHFLKSGSLVSRNLYKKQISSYKEEWEFINFKDKKTLTELPFFKKDILEKSKLFNQEFQLPNLISANKFRNSIRNFSRFTSIQIFLKRNIILFRLIINKYFTKKKKVLPKGGIIISFAGVDGSGKSTMNQNISKFFKKFMTVQNFHIGKPQGILVSNIFLKIRKKNIYKTNNSIKKDISLFSSLIAIFIAVLRNKLANKIKRKAKSGFLVFVDRWPTNKLNCMDGPRIYSFDNKNFIIKFLSFLESRIYNNFLKADLCIFFNVSLENALKRNLNRKKHNKESQYQIIDRFNQNNSVKPITKKLLYFDNNLKYESSANELIKIIWDEISRYSFEENDL